MNNSIRILLGFLFLSFKISLFAQFTTAEIKIMDELMLKKVNQLRTSKGEQYLKLDIDLQKAAKIHTDYMSEKDKLTHDEDIDNRKTPTDRVKFIGANHFAGVGENVLVSKPQRFPLSNTRLKLLVKEMYNSWFRSPGHYANMVKGDYGKVGFAYTIHKATGRVYAAQVFGILGHKVKGQLSDNSYGLTFDAAEEDCLGIFKSNVSALINVGNKIHRRGDRLVLYEHNINQFKTVFKNENDALFIDVVERSQYPCKGKNLLDLSPVHDGIILKPVFKKELIANNSSKSDYRLIAEVGVIPTFLKDKDLLFKVGIVKNGKVCSLTNPNAIPSQRYDLQEVDPKLIKPQEVQLSDEGIIASYTVNFEFEKSAAVASHISDFEAFEKPIAAIDIYSYSSIEGNLSINSRLFNERANFMKTWVKKHLKLSAAPIVVRAKENWSHFQFQLKMLDDDALLEMPKEELRLLVKTNKSQDWDSLLHEQRRSKVIIHEKGTLNIGDSKDYFRLNLRQAIIDKDYAKANLALYELCKAKAGSAVLLEPAIKNVLLEQVELVQNATALMLQNPIKELYASTEFIAFWLSRSDELSEAALFNLLQLYAKTTLEMLEDWEVHSSRLAKVLHPKYVEGLANNIEDGQLLLNFHLATIYYYGQINDYSNLSTSFDFIANHFMDKKLSLKDEIRLCLFYNSWSRYDLALNLLMLREHNKQKMNADAAFLLAKTAYSSKLLSEETLNPKIIMKYMNLAYKYDKKRWCEMVKKSFYMLEHGGIKKMYCEKCN